MELIEYDKVLAKALANIIDVGIRKQYFKYEDRLRLTKKLLEIADNVIETDIEGQAIYGWYDPYEKKLHYNPKAYKNEEEALIYILHEMKHGLDHNEEYVGFEVNNKNVGQNEGATQRFATDIAEDILGIKIDKKQQESLGIVLDTNLDEYQIQDKLNELFCLAMDIPVSQFLQLQNSTSKNKMDDIKEKFNRYADYKKFADALDGIYKIQEETWFDNYGNFLEKELEPTEEQTFRAMQLITVCQNEIMKYAKAVNRDNIVEPELIKGRNKYGEIIRGGILDDGTIEISEDIVHEVISKEEIAKQYKYIQYHNDIVSKINTRNVILDPSKVILVTEYGYDSDMDPKVVYYREGDKYKKIIVPVLENGGLDVSQLKLQDVTDISEIISEVEEFSVMGNAPEVCQIYNLLGNAQESNKLAEKWNIYLGKQDEIQDIVARVDESGKAVKDEMEAIRMQLLASSEYADFNDVVTPTIDSNENYDAANDFIQYGSIRIYEDEIQVIKQDGEVKKIKDNPDEEQEYLSKIQIQSILGTIKLTEQQQQLLDNYQANLESKTGKKRR